MTSDCAQRKVFLVSGAGGFLGLCLLRCLAERFGEDSLFATARHDKPEGFPMRGVRWMLGDLRDAEVWKKIPSSITHVFHLAARIPYAAAEGNDPELLRDNLAPISRLIDEARRWEGLRQVVYTSSISVYGTSREWKAEGSVLQPAGFYGFAKWMGEELLNVLRQKGVNVASLRLSSLYGPGQYPGTVLPTMVRDAQTEGRIRVFGSGTRTQDFLHVQDAALALVMASECGGNGIFNVGCGRPVTMLELAKTIRQVLNGMRVKVQKISSEKETDPGNKIRIRRAQKELGFVPRVSLKEGLHGLITERSVRP